MIKEQKKEEVNISKNLEQSISTGSKQVDKILSSTEKKDVDVKEINKQFKVYTMPKVFLGKGENKNKNINNSAKKNKSTVGVGKFNKTRLIGATVIFGGFCFLIGVAFIMYSYFISKLDKSSEDTPINLSSNIKTDSVQVDKIPDKTKKASLTKKVQDIVQNSLKGTSTDLIKVDKDNNLISSSSILVATSTIENISIAEMIIKNASSTQGELISDKDKLSEFIVAKDTDGDGLSDEEENIFFTDINKVDSDEDTYDDLSEILKLYNPAGKGNIMNNAQIERFINTEYSYTLYYPKSWKVSNMTDNSSVLFKSYNNQFIQIIVQENKKSESLEDWYKSQFNIDKIYISTSSAQMLEKKDWTAIQSNDGLVVYLSSSQSNYFFIISYSVGIDNVLYYKNIFRMMVNSLEVI